MIDGNTQYTLNSTVRYRLADSEISFVTCGLEWVFFVTLKTLYNLATRFLFTCSWQRVIGCFNSDVIAVHDESKQGVHCGSQ